MCWSICWCWWTETTGSSSSSQMHVEPRPSKAGAEGRLDNPWVLLPPVNPHTSEVCSVCFVAFSCVRVWYVVYSLPLRLELLELRSTYMLFYASCFGIMPRLPPCAFPVLSLYVNNTTRLNVSRGDGAYSSPGTECQPGQSSIHMAQDLAALLNAAPSWSICFGCTSSESFHSCQTGLHLLWFCMLFRSWPSLQQHIALTLESLILWVPCVYFLLSKEGRAEQEAPAGGQYYWESNLFHTYFCVFRNISKWKKQIIDIDIIKLKQRICVSH